MRKMCRKDWWLTRNCLWGGERDVMRIKLVLRRVGWRCWAFFRIKILLPHFTFDKDWFNLASARISFQSNITSNWRSYEGQQFQRAFNLFCRALFVRHSAILVQNGESLATVSGTPTVALSSRMKICAYLLWVLNWPLECPVPSHPGVGHLKRRNKIPL